MVEYCMYSADLADGTNLNWIDSIDRNTNTITRKSIIKNAKEMLERNKLPYGMYNIDLIKGPKKEVQDASFYEYCIGYANIWYRKDDILIADLSAEEIIQ